MLDRLKLLVELASVADKLFVDTTPSYHLAQDIWQSIIADPTFLYKVRDVHNAPWPVPLWQDNLGDTAVSEKVPCILFFDGSLIFWHLSSKDIDVRDYFLNAYLALLDELYQEKALVCWYISMPKSKELMSLVRLYLCNFDVEKKELYESVD